MFILENAEKQKKKVFFHIISTARNILMTILFNPFSCKYICIFLTCFIICLFLLSIYLAHISTLLLIYNFSFWIEFHYIAVP